MREHNRKSLAQFRSWSDDPLVAVVVRNRRSDLDQHKCMVAKLVTGNDPVHLPFNNRLMIWFTGFGLHMIIIQNHRFTQPFSRPRQAFSTLCFGSGWHGLMLQGLYIVHFADGFPLH